MKAAVYNVTLSQLDPYSELAGRLSDCPARHQFAWLFSGSLVGISELHTVSKSHTHTHSEKLSNSLTHRVQINPFSYVSFRCYIRFNKA